MSLTPERLRAIAYDMNTRPNVTITDRYHAEDLLAEVERLRQGIEAIGYALGPALPAAETDVVWRATGTARRLTYKLLDPTEGES